jgi:hypothetical protein
VTRGRWQALRASLSPLKPDLRDIFLLAGLGTMGTGLWMLRPWLALTVVGFLLMAAGLLMRGK